MLRAGGQTTCLDAGQRKVLHTIFPDGTELDEEYSLQTGELLLRKRRAKTAMGKMGDWEFMVGDPPQSKSLEATGIMESNSTPIFLRKDTAKEFQWRVRNLPHAPDVFSVTLEQPCRQIVVRTSNRKYFKRFTVPEMDHLHLPLEQSALSWRHNNNTLVISYQKPEAIKKLELQEQQQIKQMRAQGPGECKQQ